MIRRAFAGLLAAALLVFAPTAAFGYAEDDFDATISTTNPAPGEPFAVTVVAPTGTDVTLTVSSDAVSDDDIQIAGAKSLTKTAVDGQAVFSVTLSQEAVFQIVATDADGNVIESFQVVVGDGGTAATPVPAPGAGGGAAGPSLPETGATATPLIIGGVVLLLVGGAALFLARRGKVSA
ncbi:LPXTG cell wall anchor domain-containing protein [Georgenia phoenicis]|uniref:LPXTG cell wall anchor domain-containing protein n=1 Tax=unclassified Georgenia TaxID=2626815 RepID=UPI0039B0FA2E